MSVARGTNESSRSPMRMRRRARSRSFAFSGPGRRNMPSPTLTPDHSAAPDPDAPPAVDHDIPGEPTVLPGVRLITVPAGWPPYDCETHGAACPVTRGAAVTDRYIGGHAPEPPGLPGPAGLPDPAGLPGPAGAPEPARLPGPAGAPEPGAAWPRQFAQVIVEILAGSRPSRQLVPWTTDRVRAQVDGLTRLFTADQRPRLRRVMTSQPAVSVVEMTMVVGSGPRTRALALRFEHRPERPAAPGRPARPARWLCTEIEAG